MHAWAEAKPKLVVIADHTHRPVFMSQSLLRLLQQQVAALHQRLQTGPSAPVPEEIEEWQRLLEWAEARDSTPLQVSTATTRPPKPCYFNSGCCCFCDGEVTGIEIVGGAIRLVRWPNHRAAPVAQVVFTADLGEVLARCS